MKQLILAAVLLAGLGLVVSRQLQAAHSDNGCYSCHTPHNAGDPAELPIPLWNPINMEDAALPVYTLYSSRTFTASDISQPDGSSKLCLGCHDGTYDAAMDPDRVFTADKLATSHPVSFTYDTALATADGALNDPATTASGLGSTIAQDLLDANSKMQCTSCHDIHVTGIGPTSLRYAWDWQSNPKTDKNMCIVCHAR